MWWGPSAVISLSAGLSFMKRSISLWKTSSVAPSNQCLSMKTQPTALWSTHLQSKQTDRTFWFLSIAFPAIDQKHDHQWATCWLKGEELKQLVSSRGEVRGSYLQPSGWFTKEEWKEWKMWKGYKGRKAQLLQINQTCEKRSRCTSGYSSTLLKVRLKPGKKPARGNALINISPLSLRQENLMDYSHYFIKWIIKRHL